jgi:hypothetical protein
LEDSDQANRNNNYQGDEGPKNESGDTSARQGEQRSDIDGKEISGHASDKFDSNGEKNNSDRKENNINGEENNITGEENDTNGEEVCDYEGDGHSGNGGRENCEGRLLWQTCIPSTNMSALEEGTEEIEPTIYRDPFVPALSVFLLCHQVYEEASAIFYKNNIFVFIRNYSSGLAEYEINGNFLTAVAVPWMYKLGSRTPLLLNIVIDNGCICTSRCAAAGDFRRFDYIGRSTRTIDIGPFISTLWRLDLDLTITVKQPIAGLYALFLCVSFGEDDRMYIPVLNSLVQAIYRDKFNLKRYLYTLGGIHVSTTGTLVIVPFVSPR